MAQKRYSFQAYHFNETLRLKQIDDIIDIPSLSRSATTLIYREDDNSFVYIYRYGSLVFFNVEPERQRLVLEKVKLLIGDKDPVIISDEYGLIIEEGLDKIVVDFGHVVMSELSREKIDILALILSQSTALEHFEKVVDDLLEKSGSIMKELERKGRMTGREYKINKFIGFCMTTKQDLLSSLYLLDKPDETWDNSILESLYREASDMFELKERYKTVDHKLKMIQENLSLLADLIKARRATLLELSIVILILVEVLLFIYELVFR